MSNVVSRFHQFVTMNPSWLQQQPEANKNSNEGGNRGARNSQENFRKWCTEMDTNALLSEEEQSSPLFSHELKLKMKSIPCHSEFIKYISWHNHVVQMSWSKGYDMIQVYFDD